MVACSAHYVSLSFLLCQHSLLVITRASADRVDDARPGGVASFVLSQQSGGGGSSIFDESLSSAWDMSMAGGGGHGGGGGSGGGGGGGGDEYFDESLFLTGTVAVGNGQVGSSSDDVIAWPIFFVVTPNLSPNICAPNSPIP